MRSISCLQQDKAKLLRFMLERRKQLKGGRGKNTVNVTELNNDCPRMDLTMALCLSLY